MRDYDQYPGDGGNASEFELDLEILKELEAEQDAKNVIRGELLDELAARGVDVDDIPRSVESTEIMPADITKPNWQMIDFETAITMTVEAVRGYQLRAPHLSLDPRALEDVLMVKYDTEIFLEQARTDRSAKAALLSLLSEKIPVSVSPQHEQLIKDRLMREHENLRDSI